MGLEIFAAIIIATILTLSIEYLRSSINCKKAICFFLSAFAIIVTAATALHLLSSSPGNAGKIIEEQESSSEKNPALEIEKFTLPPLATEPLETELEEQVNSPGHKADIAETSTANEGAASPGQFIEDNSGQVLLASQMGYLSVPADLDKEISSFLDRWQAAWEKSAGVSGNIENFVSFYAQEYKHGGMNREQWQADKANKNRSKSWIKIEVENIKTGPLQNDNTLQVSFSQNYSSSNFNDKGLKSLTLKKNQGDWQILAEK